MRQVEKDYEEKIRCGHCEELMLIKISAVIKSIETSISDNYLKLEDANIDFNIEGEMLQTKKMNELKL